ncbi:ATP-dependent DNA ligase [Streptomyces sp. ISL-11]|uniref:ATP-dependent DNA ligase n=1 Tax=Streptomyces sp. ISL-11 TaxID=2819174 RepID=UPI001BE6B4E5|nr:ATP-dependent DNA ligase [Streptomyces sp. ISL-11]MBT2382054.1 ATP-dependent DNA ligase [Streptomyces sp. ISL-11]
MELPVMPPLQPMLAKSASAIPPGMQYEAKWDGFRAIVFRDRDAIELGSRSGKPLTRYFPELVRVLLEQLPPRCVVDGEIVIARGGRLDFDALLERIHPAASRVTHLAEVTPASFIAFDLLALGDESLLDTPQLARREALTDALRDARAPLHITPVTMDLDTARAWFEEYEGAGLDGVVAKPPNLPYRPGQRAMTKVKHERTADCVLAGLRPHKSGPVVGSLLLGLHDTAGHLQHVGVCASFPMRRRQELMTELEPLRMPSVQGHPWEHWADPDAQAAGRLPGGPSRWTGTKDLSWIPLRPERVCEVAYDHLQGNRFRHTTQFRRWRPDREPGECTYAQLEETPHFDLAGILDL